MDTFMVFVAFPYYYDESDEMNRWVDYDDEMEIDAENQDAANAIVQQKIDSGKLDATLMLPMDCGGTDIPIRPYIPTEDTRKKERIEDNKLREEWKKCHPNE